ncbi:MAG: methyltransferase domain-containing protein [Deltaproteobacteria bacterium]|nr:methyltransferase domain-containing protein [Deltaproteobacteria bacterium]
MICRYCGSQLKHEFIDLVNAPPSNSFLTKEQLNEPEVSYPLKLFVCAKCFLVQINEYKKSGDIFGQNYAYFSSYSTSWLDHAKRYADMIVHRFGYDSNSQVIEIASNDGYLLQYFQTKEIPALGIEPARNVARTAQAKGIETIVDFFGLNLADYLVAQSRMADLIIGNNVFAHVPDINDFVAGMKKVLKKDGVITLEFPHLMQLVEQTQFDTIYHEHFSYFSFHTAGIIVNHYGLDIFDVEQLPTHGGSLRIYLKHKEDKSKKISDNVSALSAKEESNGMLGLPYYEDFNDKVNKVKYNFIKFLLQQKMKGRKVAAYGAAAKGNTLINYCGVKKDLIEFVVDASPHKQGMYLPGSHIPIVNEEHIREARPDFVFILPWNIKEEIMQQLEYIRKWDGKFAIAIPEVRIF